MRGIANRVIELGEEREAITRLREHGDAFRVEDIPDGLKYRDLPGSGSHTRATKTGSALTSRRIVEAGLKSAKVIFAVIRDCPERLKIDGRVEEGTIKPSMDVRGALAERNLDVDIAVRRPGLHSTDRQNLLLLLVGRVR